MVSQETLQSTEFQSASTLNCVVLINILQLLTFYFNSHNKGSRIITSNLFSILQLILLILFTVYVMKIELDPNMYIIGIVGLSIYLAIKGFKNAFHKASTHDPIFRRVLRFLETIVASHCLSVVIIEMNNLTSKYQKYFLQVLIPIFFFLSFFIISKIKVHVLEKFRNKPFSKENIFRWIFS